MQRYESEFLELRQRIKESIRKKMQNGNDIDPTPTSEQRKRKLPYHDFGSFFGPSQTVIASRVLQDSKPLLEDKLLASKMLNLTPTEEKRNAEKLKDSRDYSFLLSDDDAQLPVSLKEPPSRSVSSGTQMQPKPSSSTNSSKLRPVPARKPASVPVDHRTKPLASDPKPKQQRKVSNELARSQMIPRKSLPPTKHRVISKPELKRDHQLKKKKRKKMSEEDDLALKMVREMCKTDRYAGRDFDDYDDRNMEASFEDIIKEEKRSARLAKKEDAEQLRLIEEENRQERVTKEKKKKPKLSH